MCIIGGTCDSKTSSPHRPPCLTRWPTGGIPCRDIVTAIVEFTKRLTGSRSHKYESNHFFSTILAASRFRAGVSTAVHELFINFSTFSQSGVHECGFNFRVCPSFGEAGSMSLLFGFFFCPSFDEAGRASLWLFFFSSCLS
jgi:hypothetical protein